jgi:hypothetical protein
LLWDRVGIGLSFSRMNIAVAEVVALKRSFAPGAIRGHLYGSRS